MNDQQFSKEISEILSYSKEEAMRTGNYLIAPDHLLLGIIRHKENLAYEMVVESKISPVLFKLEITDKVRKGEGMIPFELSNKVEFETDTQSIIKIMLLEARADSQTQPNSLHLLLAILRVGDSFGARLLEQSGFTYQYLKDRIGGEQDEIEALDLIDDFHPGDSFSDEDSFMDSDDELEGGDFEDDEFDPMNFDEELEREREGRSEKNNRGGSSKTPYLDKFGFDLTKAAREGRLDPVVGREKEISRVAQILGRRKKNNPVLIGEPGVGKSAIVEGLALRIVKRDISRSLLNKKIVSLDIGSLVAGTKFRGQFEERIKAILNELKDNKNIIVFIDEMHTLVGAGGAVGSLDAANMLKPALSRGEIQCIGATTLDEYREIIEKDGALERRFQKIIVEPATFEETLEILNVIKQKYEEHHNVSYTPEAIKACINLSIRYITDRSLPDKAIDIMDEAGSKAHLENLNIPDSILKMEEDLEGLRERKRKAVDLRELEAAVKMREEEKELEARLSKMHVEWIDNGRIDVNVVTEENVANVVSVMTGIPISKIATSESNKLMSMADVIEKKVVGQNEAVEKVVKAIRRSRAGIKDPNKPIGTFLFMGPTGVGKTQLAKALAEYLFDTQDALIRIDMSEYMEKFAVSRLIGAPPGYVGYEEGGQLSERVRRKPYSVVLLDEIEKAHPDIFNLLLQVLDEGRLTDSNGRFIDFKNTVLIMTSNVGSRDIKDFGQGIGFGSSSGRNDIGKNNRSIVDKAIEKTFAPEFINRLDEKILFNPLTKDDINKIIDIELKYLYKRIEQIGYKLSLDKKAKDFVAEKGYDPRYGARPLKRAIQQYVEDVVAEAIISSPRTGSTIKITLNKTQGGLVSKIVQKVSSVI